MKDIHGDRPTPGPIPIISPALHCVAMPVLVYLRSSFGLTLFRPRSIFFALSITVGVLDYIAWNEPEIWPEYRTVCIFAGGAVILYWLHFAITFFRELYRKSERDDHSGTSHFTRILKCFGIRSSSAEMNVHLWLEPILILLIAALLRYGFAEQHLSNWLVIVAVCMFAKESLNCWAEIRREKIAKDLTEDAEERGKALDQAQAEPEAPQAARVAAQTIKRNVVLSPEEARARRFADTLGISEPYDLDEAEASYRRRIQLCHPDTMGDSPENNNRTTELNEAIDFFREKLGG